MRNRRSHPAAFTLIELIMVLVILTLVVAAVAPKLRMFGAGQSMKDRARLIVGLAQYCRTQAVTQGHTYRLNVEPSTRKMWITTDNGSGTYEAPGNEFGAQFELPDNLSMTSDFPTHDPDGQYAEFRPNGRTDPGKVQLTNGDGDIVEVSCASPTELFRVLPPGEVTK